MMMGGRRRAGVGMMMCMHRVIVHRFAMHVHAGGCDRKIDVKAGRGTRSKSQRRTRREHADEIAEREQPPGPDPQ